MHNILVSDTNYGGIKDARDEDDNNIISFSSLHSLLPPQVKKSARYKVRCGCECCIYAKSIHSLLISWHDRYLKKFKYQNQNAQNRRSGEKSNHIYETYKNTVMTHGRHIYAKTSDMAHATMCTYTKSDYAIPHWKCVLRCCADCTCINLPDKEIDYQYSYTTPSIRFHTNHIISCCTTHGRIPLKDNKICYICKHESSSDKSTKIYTRKELVMTETTISDFRTSFYIPAIQKLTFHLPHVCILGTHHCGEMQLTTLKRRELFQYVLCCRDYAERVVACFSHQIKLEYYGGNISVSIEGIVLEHFSALPHTNIN